MPKLKNTITASIEFYYKGEKFSPCIEIDVDQVMQSRGQLSEIHTLIAKKNGIDAYSYEFEMMQGELIVFSGAAGLVADYVSEGVLDFAAFETAWQDNHVSAKLQLLVEKHSLAEAMQQHPKIRDAMLEAYQLGKLIPSQK